MKFSKELMTNKDVQNSKVGGFATRSTRNEWAESYEELVRALSPYPISYDVSQGQGLGFSEFTYTELLGGLWVASQSLELNCKLLEEASLCEYNGSISELDYIVSDKYDLVTDPKFQHIDKVCFLPGHNLLEVASVEITSRLAHEDDEVYFKPHPITNNDALKIIATRVGWNKVIPKDISGNYLLKNCSEVYTTTASEMAISGTILGKCVYNVSNYFNEGSGAYLPISRVLFKKHKTSVEAAQQALLNIINCPWSGIILPHHKDVENRLKQYYQKALEYRAKYKPIASPKGNPPGKNK